MKHIISSAALGALAAMGTPFSAVATTHESDKPAAQAAAALAEGEVRRINREANKITIRHGPIVNLDMPPMTMVFQVSDPVLLENLKAGDKIRFSADKIGGAYTVIDLEPAR